MQTQTQEELQLADVGGVNKHDEHHDRPQAGGPVSTWSFTQGGLMVRPDLQQIKLHHEELHDPSAAFQTTFTSSFDIQSKLKMSAAG